MLNPIDSPIFLSSQFLPIISLFPVSGDPVLQVIYLFKGYEIKVMGIFLFKIKCPNM